MRHCTTSNNYSNSSSRLSQCRRSKTRKISSLSMMTNLQQLRWRINQAIKDPMMMNGMPLLMFSGLNMMQINLATSIRKRSSLLHKQHSPRLALTSPSIKMFYRASSLKSIAMEMVRLTRMSCSSSWRVLYDEAVHEKDFYYFSWVWHLY